MVMKVLLNVFLGDPGVNFDTNPHGWTPLLFAAQRGHNKIVEALLAKDDIRVNATAPSPSRNPGYTPLQFACQIYSWHEKVAELLITDPRVDPNKGYKTKAKDRNGTTALWFAPESGNEMLVPLLLTSGRVSPSLQIKDGLCWTPLNIVVNNGYLAIAQMLLESLSADEVDSYGKEHLRRATEAADHQMINFLQTISGINAN